MKKINYKILIITGIICLLPILLGLFLYNKLPETIAIHFDINNIPDGFASKNFVVFGIPILMLLLQAFCCVITDINIDKKGNEPKLIKIVRWVIPILTIVIYVSMLIYALGIAIDITTIACLLVGTVFVIVGNYLPKITSSNYSIIRPKSITTNEKLWRKISRIIGILSIIVGLIFIISIFF